MANLAGLRRGRVRVGLPPMVGAAFFPSVLADFHAAYPGIALELREEGARQVEALVLEHELDVGVTVLPADAAAFGVLPFVRDVLLAVLPPSSPLARRDALALRDLSEVPFVLYRPDFALHGHILEACGRAGFTPRVASESSQWDFIAAMVAAGIGVAFLPRTICRRLDPHLVATVPLVDPVSRWDLALVWRRAGYLPEATRAFVEVTRRRLAPDASPVDRADATEPPRRGRRP